MKQLNNYISEKLKIRPENIDYSWEDFDFLTFVNELYQYNKISVDDYTKNDILEVFNGLLYKLTYISKGRVGISILFEFFSDTSKMWRTYRAESKKDIEEIQAAIKSNDLTNLLTNIYDDIVIKGR